MKKISGILLIGLLVLSQTALAFTYSEDLADQIAEYSNTMINSSGYLELSKVDSRMLALDISPNYATDKLMYLSTEDGVYTNVSFDANFQKNTVLSAKLPTGFKKLQFEGDYVDTGMMLAYSKDKIFISYNFGGTWDEILLNINEEIMEADFGPNFASNQQIYVVTNNGFYRKSIVSGNVEKLLTADIQGELKNFRYVRTQVADNVFFIVKGNKLLKTENFASTWIETAFSTTIKDFEIKQTNTNEGNLMVLTDDNKIHYSNWAISFFDLTLPSEITTIYSVDYLILTNNGFYITYDNGNKWNRLNYSSLDPSIVSDYDLVVDGSQKLLYVTYNNTLKRDQNLVESFADYMTGVQLASGYAAQGTAVSKEVLAQAEMQFGEDYKVTSATLHAEGDLNGQTMNFYMTADGENWEAVDAGVSHDFVYPGAELYWKAEMTTNNASVTPVLRSVLVNYGVDEMINCAGFIDVPYNYVSCPAIQYVKAQGIFSGYPDGAFMPDQEINRAETVKVITEGFNLTQLAADGTNLGFSDVETAAWYMGYLKTAKEAGIIEGYPDGTFKPAETVIYAEMLKIFFETAGVELSAAAEGAEWYQPYVDYANTNNLVQYSNVAAGMKRGDVAELFYQWSKL